MSASVSLENILNASQWSKESTFYTFYCKDIVTSVTSATSDFAFGVLDTILLMFVKLMVWLACLNYNTAYNYFKLIIQFCSILSRQSGCKVSSISVSQDTKQN